jgi:hypothetical protein
MDKLHELEKTVSILCEGLNQQKEIAEKRGTVLSLMLEELKYDNLKVDRIEGFYSYIVTYKLQDLIESKNWFVGVLLASALLDDVGKRKLKRQFKGKINPDKIDNLQFEQTIMLLLASNLIDDKTYERMIEIKNLRNDFAHNSWKALKSFMETGKAQTKSSQKSRAIIKKAIKCLDALNPPITH